MAQYIPIQGLAEKGFVHPEISFDNDLLFF